MSNITKIKISGTSYSIKDENACNVVELTQAEYDALPSTAKTSNSLFIITDAQGADLSQYYTSAQTESAITAAVSGKVDTSTFNTYSGSVDTALSGKQETLVSGTNIKTINNESLLGSGNITIQGGGGTSYSAGTGIDITNDVISVTGMVDTATFNTYSGSVDTALSGKQDTLSAGTGIEISGNVISATGGGGGGMTEDDELLLATALTDLNDRKIDVSEVKSNYQKKGDYVTTNTLNTRLAEYETVLDEQNVEEVTAYALCDLNERFGGLKIVKITESEYEALTTKDENTLYVVVADPT